MNVTSALIGQADEGQVSVLTLLDLSAAFDALDHFIPLMAHSSQTRIVGKVDSQILHARWQAGIFFFFFFFWYLWHGIQIV